MIDWGYLGVCIVLFLLGVIVGYFVFPDGGK